MKKTGISSGERESQNANNVCEIKELSLTYSLIILLKKLITKNIENLLIKKSLHTASNIFCKICWFDCRKVVQWFFSASRIKRFRRKMEVCPLYLDSKLTSKYDSDFEKIMLIKNVVFLSMLRLFFPLGEQKQERIMFIFAITFVVLIVLKANLVRLVAKSWDSFKEQCADF